MREVPFCLERTNNSIKNFNNNSIPTINANITNKVNQQIIDLRKLSEILSFDPVKE